MAEEMMIRLPVRFVSAGQFAGAGHWLHPDRTLGTSVIIVVERGCFGACVDQRRYVVKAGQALLLPAGHRHFGVPVEGAEPPVYYWAHFESGSSLYGDALGFDGLHIDLPDPAVNRLVFEF
ncbi:MAG: AraC family ligand binding domain-containing protein, partial [Eubacteriales bacterium]